MPMGKILIFLGVIIVIIGVLVQAKGQIPFLGKLPGDIIYEKGNTKIYIPITTSILISLILSILIFLINKLRG